MSAEILFILSLHSIAAAISMIGAFRDGLGFAEILRWALIGFITGIIGLITRRRMDRRHVHYMHIVQDALVNLGMEGVALYGIHYFLVE
jgi:hypothetical protein